MSKYTNGYWAKIDYWTNKLNVATVKDDLPAVKLALSKLNYFVQRQDEVYGNNQNVIAGVDFSESLNLLKSL
jgi:hypothetical protein